MTSSADDVMASIDFPGHLRCGWGPRRESAAQVAHRLQELNRRLAAIEQGHSELWPLLAARPIRPGVDPGPILQMSRDDLTKLIERRARYEAPQLPAPVSEEGYRIDLVTTHSYKDALRLDLTLRAGAFADGCERNRLEIEYHPTHRLWCDPELRQKLIVGMVEVLHPDWACAARKVGRNESGQLVFAPWIVWAAPGCEAPHWLVGTPGPPSAAWPTLGGDLLSWSEP